MERNFNPEDIMNHPGLTEEQRALFLRLIQMGLNPLNMNGLDASPSRESEASEIPTKPLFDFHFIEEDSLETELVKYLLNEKNTTDKSSFIASLMLITGFGRKDFSDYLKNLYHGKVVKTGLCRKLLKTNKDVGYCCLDCQKDPTCIICSSCFEKSNHKGHRIFLKQQVSGMCDCGDADAWDAKGNCSDHSGYVEEDNFVTAAEKEQLISAIKKTFYFISQGFEYYSKHSKKQKNHISVLMCDVFELLMELCGLYPSLTPVVSKAIYTPLLVNGKPVLLHHDPNRMDGINEIKEEAQSCQENILGLLFRYSLYFSDEGNKKFRAFVVSMFADYQYKKVLAIEYINYFAFFFDHESLDKTDQPRASSVVDLSIQILTSEELGLIALQKADSERFLTTILGMLRKRVKDGVLNWTFQFWRNKVYSTLDYCLMKKQGITYFFSEPRLYGRYVEILKLVQETQLTFTSKPKEDLTHIGTVVFDQLNMTENLLESNLEICGVLISLDKESRKRLLQNILICLKNSILSMNESKVDETIKDSEDAETQESSKLKRGTTNQKYYVALLERCFCSYLIAYCYFDFDQDGKVAIVEFKADDYDSLLKEVFTDQAEREGFWAKVGTNFAQISGFMREISRNCWVAPVY